MWTVTEITKRLGIDYPIIQGPLGGGVSPARLVATVSNAGGLGSCGANALTPEEIKDVAAEIRSRTDRPFALNLWTDLEPASSRESFERSRDLLLPYYQELGLDRPRRPRRFGQNFATQVKAVLAAKPAVFSFVLRIPSREILDECRRRGIFTIGTATTLDEARALEKAGVDAITATGFEAGGMRSAFLKPEDDSLLGTLALLPQVVDAVKVPVIAAGGIADARGLGAALVVGAHAVQIGTAFLACEESGAPQAHRDMLFSGAAKDTVVSRVFNERMARVIRNRFVDEMTAHLALVAPFPIQSWLTGTLRKAAIEQGRTELISMQASQSAALLRHRHAAILMEELKREPSRLFARFAPQARHSARW